MNTKEITIEDAERTLRAFTADVREELQLWGLTDPSFDEPSNLKANRDASLKDMRKARWDV